MNPRIIILGLDGATWHVLKPLIDSGEMPNLGALLSKGASGKLLSSIPPLTAPAWTEFQTGSNPGKHGVFDFRIFDRPARRLWLVSSRDIRLPTIWQIASAAGMRVVALNVPLTYPPQPVNGLVIGGLLAQNVDRTLIYPPQRWEEIIARHPHYLVSPPLISQRGAMGRKAFIQANIDVEEQRLALALDLLKNEPWDIFMLQNQSLDYIQHAYFHHLDPASRQIDPQARKDVLAFYHAIDRNIGRILDAAPSGSDVLVLSDHGFKLQHKVVHLTSWLRKEGYLVEHINARQRLLQLGRRIDIFNLRHRLLHRVLPTKQKRFAAGAASSLSRVDWEKSQAYVAIGSVYGCIYFNRRVVRDPQALSEELRNHILTLKDPSNGKPVAERVHRGDEIYQGPYAASGPDLVVVPAPDYTFGAPSLVAHKDTITPIDFSLEIPGGHHPEGIFLWAGNGILPSKNLRSRLRDLAPTILARLGLNIPEHMDGHPLEDLFAQGLSFSRQPWEGAIADQTSGSLSPQDEDKLHQRLSDLGYL